MHNLVKYIYHTQFIGGACLWLSEKNRHQAWNIFNLSRKKKKENEIVSLKKFNSGYETKELFSERIFMC